MWQNAAIYISGSMHTFCELHVYSDIQVNFIFYFFFLAKLIISFIGCVLDNEGNVQIAKLDEELSADTVKALKRCFFMSCATISKLVDIFYGTLY